MSETIKAARCAVCGIFGAVPLSNVDGKFPHDCGRILKESNGFEGAADVRLPTFLAMSYPERDEHGLSKKYFTLDLEDVRAAQYMVVRFDFARDGWALFMPITGKYADGVGGIYCNENGNYSEDPIYRQVGFVPSWAAEIPGPVKMPKESS